MSALNEVMAKLDKVEKMTKLMGEELRLLREQKLRLVACLAEVGKEVKEAGGQYLVDRINDTLQKILQQDHGHLTKARSL